MVEKVDANKIDLTPITMRPGSGPAFGTGCFGEVGRWIFSWASRSAMYGHL